MTIMKESLEIIIGVGLGVFLVLIIFMFFYCLLKNRFFHHRQRHRHGLGQEEQEEEGRAFIQPLPQSQQNHEILNLRVYFASNMKFKYIKPLSTTNTTTTTASGVKCLLESRDHSIKYIATCQTIHHWNNRDTHPNMTRMKIKTIRDILKSVSIHCPNIAPLETLEIENRKLITVYQYHITLRDFIQTYHASSIGSMISIGTGKSSGSSSISSTGGKSKKRGLPRDLISQFSRQILLGLKFLLLDNDLPYFHLSTTQILLVKQRQSSGYKCLLNGLELSLLGIEYPFQHQLLRSTLFLESTHTHDTLNHTRDDLEKIQIIQFGHVLIEMCTGKQVETLLPDTFDQHEYPFKEVVELIFGKLASIDHLYYSRHHKIPTISQLLNIFNNNSSSGSDDMSDTDKIIPRPIGTLNDDNVQVVDAAIRKLFYNT